MIEIGMKAKLLKSAAIVLALTALFALLVDDSWYSGLHYKFRRVAGFGATLRWLFVEQIGYWQGVALFAILMTMVQGFFFVGGAKGQRGDALESTSSEAKFAPVSPDPLVKPAFGRRMGHSSYAPTADNDLSKLALRVIREKSVDWYLCHLDDERKPEKVVAQLNQAGDFELANLIAAIARTYYKFEAIRTSRDEGELTKTEVEEYDAATRPLELQVNRILKARG